MTTPRPVRVAFLNTHPIQYFAPLYAYLNAAPDLTVKAIYLSDYSLRGANDRAFGQTIAWDVDLLGGYEAVFLPGAERREEPRGFFSMVAPQLWGVISRAKLDALVVHGHAPAAMMVGIAAAKARGIPVFMRGETHLGLQRSSLKAALRKPLMQALYGRLDAMLAIGSANRAFYRAMGTPDKRIFTMPYTVDNARFSAGAQLSAAARATQRAALGVTDERPIVLYSAKFQGRKRPGDLIRAAADLNAAGVRFHLAMVGSGELEGELRALAAALAVANISFPGFVNQSGLPAIYGAADVFVLASENEPWGLAVNEAMCAGLPIVATDAVGCAADLVRGGVNGAGDPGGRRDRAGRGAGADAGRCGPAPADGRGRPRDHRALELRRMPGRAARGAGKRRPDAYAGRSERWPMKDALPTPAGPAPLQIAIVGRVGFTHIGESLSHAATMSGHKVTFFDADGRGGRALALQRALAWRIGRRPVSLDRFATRVADACARHPPDLMITTGAGALTADALQAIRRAGVPLANYSTDDPWNPALKAGWHLRALPHYDVVFTPRQANMEDFRRLGCGDVRYLPFGYDERHARPPEAAAADAAEVLFVGGADRDRVGFVEAFVGQRMPISLVGGYWDRFASVRRYASGVKTPDDLRSLTAAAKLNLCLVRRANRDGHVMRSLEIGAIGGCMLAEDTAEHRELLGPDGEAVVYFTSPADAADKAATLIAAQAERRRMAAALRTRILNGGHSYGDRLQAMLSAALPADKLAAARPLAESASA